MCHTGRGRPRKQPTRKRQNVAQASSGGSKTKRSEPEAHDESVRLTDDTSSPLTTTTHTVTEQETEDTMEMHGDRDCTVPVVSSADVSFISAAEDVPSLPGTSAQRELAPELPLVVTALSFESDQEKALPQSTFVDRELSYMQACKLCDHVPVVDICQTLCKHIFCKGCITLWMKSSSTCPHCRVPIGDDDIHELQDEALQAHFDQLVCCQYSDFGCSTK